MFIVPMLLRKLSLRILILTGALILPLRWFLYLFIQDPAWILPTQAMHGVTIVSFFVVGALFIDQKVPPRWRATGQGLYATAMHGIGSAVGLYFAGMVLEWFNVRAIWGLNLALGLVGLVLLILAMRAFRRSSQEVS
jgi:PPP family 3-phenylpropionic acid transporter